MDHFRRFLSRVKGDRVHIIAHSMGGILTREVLEDGFDLPPGRVVALGSPFMECWIGRRGLSFGGPVGPYLIGATVHEYVQKQRVPVWRGGRDLAVMAGTFNFGIGRYFPTMPKPCDGVIVWNETRLGGAQHCTFNVNHFGLLISWRVFCQIAWFLKYGHFRAGLDESLGGVIDHVPADESVEALAVDSIH